MIFTVTKILIFKMNEPAHFSIPLFRYQDIKYMQFFSRKKKGGVRKRRLKLQYIIQQRQLRWVNLLSCVSQKRKSHLVTLLCFSSLSNIQSNLSDLDRTSECVDIYNTYI